MDTSWGYTEANKGPYLLKRFIFHVSDNFFRAQVSLVKLGVLPVEKMRTPVEVDLRPGKNPVTTAVAVRPATESKP